MASATGKSQLHDLPCSGCPVTAVSPEMLQHGDAIICKDQCITTQWAHSLSISKGSVSHIVHDLGYSKVCTGWIPGNLTFEHKTDRKAIFSELLACFEGEGDSVLYWIVTADEVWVYRFELESKRQSTE